MKALKILIVEDDMILAEELQEQLVEFGYVITDTVTNSTDALTAFRRRLPDLIICDIQLNDSRLDGVELANEFNKIEKVPLIFLTSFGDEKTVQRAKKANPAYYLIKPCNTAQLQVAIDFAISNFIQKKEADPEHSLGFHPAQKNSVFPATDYFFIKNGHKYVRVEVADIAYIEALGTNVKIVTEKFNVVLAANMSSFSRQLQHKDLIRVHRSYILHLKKITSFEKGRAFVVYKDGQKEIPIGKTYRDDFQNSLPRLMAD